jgi:hypothetical protein
MEGSERTPGGDILLGRHRNQLVNPLIQAAPSPTSESRMAPQPKVTAKVTG